MPAWFDITHLDSAGLTQMMKGRPFDPEGTKVRPRTGSFAERSVTLRWEAA